MAEHRLCNPVMTVRFRQKAPSFPKKSLDMLEEVWIVYQNYLYKDAKGVTETSFVSAVFSNEHAANWYARVQNNLAQLRGSSDTFTVDDPEPVHSSHEGLTS
jgi:hypothetical protein